MQIKSFYTQQHCCVSLKILYPGGIRTRVFLFLRRMRCPLRHATRAFYTNNENSDAQCRSTSRDKIRSNPIHCRLSPVTQSDKCKHPITYILTDLSNEGNEMEIMRSTGINRINGLWSEHSEDLIVQSDQRNFKKLIRWICQQGILISWVDTYVWRMIELNLLLEIDFGITNWHHEIFNNAIANFHHNEYPPM
jgi:hypothetical protein